MDADTIFPSVSNGEQILGKYRHKQTGTNTESIVTLTNLRLLVHWKETFCGCFRQSKYSAIGLNSISRIDDDRPDRRYSIVFIICIILFNLGIVSSFVVVTGNTRSILIGCVAFLLLCGLMVGVHYYSLMKTKFVVVFGTFGSVWLAMDTLSARQFEGRISQMMYQIQSQRTSSGQQSMTMETSSAPLSGNEQNYPLLSAP